MLTSRSICYCEITLRYKNAYTHVNVVLYHSVTVISIPLILIVLSASPFFALGSAIDVYFSVSRVGFHGHIFSYCLTSVMKPGVK